MKPLASTCSVHTGIVVQSLSFVWLFAHQWTAVPQASPSLTISEFIQTQCTEAVRPHTGDIHKFTQQLTCYQQQLRQKPVERNELSSFPMNLLATVHEVAESDTTEQ